MKRARFTEEQIIGILRENDAGAKTGELARKHGVPEGTIYAWKAKFGGMSVSEAQRLKALEDENRRLKSLLADTNRLSIKPAAGQGSHSSDCTLRTVRRALDQAGVGPSHSPGYLKPAPYRITLFQSIS